MLIASGIAASIGTLITDVYGVAQHTDEIARNPRLLALALGIGVATSLGRGLDSGGATPRASIRCRRCRKASIRSCRPERTGCAPSWR